MKKLILIILVFTAYNVCYGQLRVVSPNGGETFPNGADIEIIWEGVEEDAIVNIEYSTDLGKSWITITNNASGLKYTWKNTPKLPDNRCKIRIWLDKFDDGSKYYIEYNMIGPKKFVMYITWNPNGKYLASVSEDYKTIIWDIENRVQKFVYEGWSWDIDWSPDGTKFAFDNKGSICVYDLENGSMLCKLKDSKKMRHVTWSHDGTKIAATINDIEAGIWDAENGSMLHLLSGHGNLVSDLAWSPDCNMVATTAWDSKVIIWDAITGSSIHVLSVPSKGNYNVVWTLDGNFIIASGPDGIARKWSAWTGSLVKPFIGHTNEILWSEVSPNGEQLATASYDSTAGVWDIQNGTLSKQFHCSDRIWDVSWSPDNKWIATAGVSNDIEVFNLYDDSKHFKLIGHTASVRECTWSPNGIKLASCGWDNTIKIWNKAPTGIIEDETDSAFYILNQSLISNDIDMGKSLVGIQKDSIIKRHVTNPSLMDNSIKAIYFEGNDKSMFSTNFNNFNYIIRPGKSLDMDFHFKPAFVGQKTAVVVIITEFDTIRRNITGEGVLPEIVLLNNNIDFGEVILNKSKDSLVLLLHNKSPQQVRIDLMKLTGANPGQFEIPNNIPFFMKSNEQKEILLRFKPTAIGLQTCNLECKFEGPGSPAITQLLGTGIFRPAEIQAGAVTFESLICKQSTESAIPLTNNGMEGLIIKGAEITGTNLNDFEIVPPFSQMTIPPSETKDLNILFKPTGTGIRNANLVLTSNSYIDSILTIQLSSTKDSIALIPEVSKINLGFLCPGENKDTSLIIRNDGTIQSGGYAVPTAGLSLENPEFTIDKANSVSIPFRFVGKPDEGIFNETITITDSVCGYSRIVEISGEIALPVIEISDVLFTARKGKTKDSQLSITNTGKRDLIIPNPPVITPPFKLIGNPFPLTIPTGESREITVRFTPEDTLLHESDISLLLEPCSFEWKSTAVGKGYIARARLRAGNAEGFAGDKVEIPVYLEESDNITLAGAKTINTDLLFNPSVLAPQDRQITIIDDNTGSVTLENMPLTGIAGEEIARVKFTAALGNAEYNPIYFSNIESDAGEVEFDTISGSFRLLGICRDGGDRLISSKGGVILSILPNPAGETLEIELGLWESGRTRLYLSDITGSEVKQIFDGNVTTYGKRKLTANLNELADGVYFVILQTPSGRQSAMIVKN